jgi:hypothetical protein
LIILTESTEEVDRVLDHAQVQVTFGWNLTEQHLPLPRFNLCQRMRRSTLASAFIFGQFHSLFLWILWMDESL